MIEPFPLLWFKGRNNKIFGNDNFSFSHIINNLLKHLRHPNILLYIGGNISGNQHFLVTEYCENGNLFEFLHGKDAPILEDIERINLALEIAQGINLSLLFYIGI